MYLLGSVKIIVSRPIMTRQPDNDWFWLNFSKKSGKNGDFFKKIAEIGGFFMKNDYNYK